MKVENSLLTKIIFIIIVFIGCGSSPKSTGNTTVNSKDGSSIFYKVQGEGNTTIVFVHGWAGNHEVWNRQIEYFSKKHRVVLLDLAGHGSSSSNRQNYTMSAFGEDVASVVNKIGGDNIVLVGHSMGGVVVIEAAKLLGDKVVSIVGVDSFYTSFKPVKSQEEIDQYMEPFEDNFKLATSGMVRDMFTQSADPALITSIVNQMSNSDADIGRSSLREMFKWSGINIPSSLQRYGEKLHNINASSSEDEIALDESVVLIPKVGHFIPQVKADEFNRVLAEIISKY